MSERAVVRTLVLLAMNVGIAAPLVAHAQLLSEIDISYDASDTAERAVGRRTRLSPHHPSAACIGAIALRPSVAEVTDSSLFKKVADTAGIASNK